MKNSTILSGRVIVITGASSGIGAAFSQRCVRLGARVVIASKQKKVLEELSASLGGENFALPIECDVTRHGDHIQLLDATLEHFGRLDCWVKKFHQRQILLCHYVGSHYR